MMAQYPAEKIAELSYRYRTLGLGYANLGGLLMASGIAYDSHEGARSPARITALMTGTAYAVSAEMARAARAVRGLRPEPRGDAQGDPQPPARRPRREARLRGPLGPAGCDRCRARAGPRAGRGRPEGLGPGARGGPRLWLPQRPDHGDRADRHDRPGHGLRHDRHRARLRAGQVQEAGGRRLLQDHQPHGAEGAGEARLRAGPGRRRRALRGRPRHAQGRARDQPRDARRQGLHGRGPGAARARPAERLRHQIRVQPLYAGRSLLPGRARHHRGAAGRPALRPAERARLHARPVRGRQPLLLRRHDRRGRAAPEGRAPAGVRLRQPLRPPRPALPRDREPHQDDGGRPAVHLGRHLQDHQHAGNRERRGLRPGLSRRLAARPQGDGALPRRLEALAALVLEPARRGAARGRRRCRPRLPPHAPCRSPSAWSSA